ncbi:CoB--CoM heterodisulfide reductase iron-sulfur subunit B family protein [Heliobacterium chlorum]|uniref:CoB--CoM heterodisulfide reductase iron-sulfur subunit B family protein n=1 Tax=Heliobacterium chlorum TaxID=2698 RepID=A0ABR7SXC7_HELCL|nr:CoB--CoM heterodisulfide reductase iron-sulfur subunit B family protein [Heliobacterium chlorum]MBC9783208.1 CoB--CoM heterodisulfide reductase iron-sulfur subunit B family protein [Heliobacterium chlorum]
MKYGLYPGCSLNGTGIEYGLSTKAVAQKLGIDFVEIPDWNCCGASSAHNRDHLLSVALPARNLALAEQHGLDQIAVPCAACYQRMKAAEVALRDEPTRREVGEVIEMKVEGKSRTRALVEVFTNDLDAEFLSSVVVRPLSGLKVASYYGCLLVKPAQVAIDSPENPMIMDKLMAALGATPVEWSYKTECCGGSLAITRPEASLGMTANVLKYAKLAGADCIVTPCPLCTSNLDMRQKAAEGLLGMELGLPIYYFTELMGVALGLEMSQLGLTKHFVEATSLLKNTPAAQ